MAAATDTQQESCSRVQGRCHSTQVTGKGVPSNLEGEPHPGDKVTSWESCLNQLLHSPTHRLRGPGGEEGRIHNQEQRPPASSPWGTSLGQAADHRAPLSEPPASGRLGQKHGGQSTHEVQPMSPGLLHTHSALKHHHESHSASAFKVWCADHWRTRTKGAAHLEGSPPPTTARPPTSLLILVCPLTKLPPRPVPGQRTNEAASWSRFPPP